MYYVSPLDSCIHWLAVKHSLALIMLQIALVFQTYSDQCTSLIRDRNISAHTDTEWKSQFVTVGWAEIHINK